MQVEILDSFQAVGRRAADVMGHTIRAKSTAVLGLASGMTAVATYNALVDDYQAGRVDFRGVTTFNLDEYVSLSKTDPHSFAAYMHRNFFRWVNISPDRIHIPQGYCANWDRACADYDQKIDQAGGIDVQLLGIGRNGHVGFNEPNTPWDWGTHVTALADQTRRDNARDFEGNLDEVPSHAITMGIKTILHARQLVLLAVGAHKAEIIAKALTGPVTSKVPASIVQIHQNALVLLDPLAAAHLK